MKTLKVYRDEIKEGRDGYFVTYQPADARFPFASLDLVFAEGNVEGARVARAMEEELQSWLKRYAVPVMVSAFDTKENLIRIRPESGECHLMGYCDLKDGRLVHRWGLFKNEELPPEQADGEYLQKVYQEVAFRSQATVHESVEREFRNRANAVRVIIVLIVGVPVLIEVVSLGVAWVGYVVQGICIMVGIYKAAKAFGWLKPSEHAKAKAEKELKMGHYYWHCERNPEAFNRLKIENFERETIERTRNESEALSKKKRAEE